MTQSRRLVRRGAPYLLLAGIVALVFWPVWIAGYSFPKGGGDLWGQLLPVWSYVSHYVRRGVIPLWSTRLMAGDPIIGEPQYGILNPSNWWLFLVGTRSHVVVLIRGLLPIYLAGAGMYSYLRRSSVWRLRRGAALVGATAYMLSDPFITHLGHPQINDAMAWLPWCLLVVDLTIEARRFLPLAALGLALVALAGHYQTSLLAYAAIGLYALWRILGQPAHRWLRHAAHLGLAAICAAALAMPTVLPSWERYPFTERAILQLQEWRGYQWPVQMVIDLVAPGFHGRGTTGFWGPWARVEGGYAGAVTLFLAILGLLHGLKHGRTWILLLLGGLSLLFALGYDGPLYPYLARIDLIARMGKTARAIFLLSFTIAALGAAGAQALYEARRQVRWLWGLLLMVGGVLVLLRMSGWTQSVPVDRRAPAIESLIAAGILALALGITGLAPSTWRRSGPSLVLLLLAGELVISTTWVELEPPSPSQPQPAIDYLKQDPNWYRVDVDASARGLLSPPVLLSEGFEVPQGSGNPMELFSYTQFYWAIPYKGAPVYQLLGVKYIVVPKGAPPGGDGIWPVYTEAPWVDVHLNTNALPRAWLVYTTRPVATIEEAYAVVFDEAFRPAEVAAIENGPLLENQGTGTLEVRVYGPNRAEFIVRTSEEALLVLSDMHYPGWVASVDGISTPLYKANGIFRGVIVPRGEHLIAMRYRPRSFRLGVGLASVAMLTLLSVPGKRLLQFVRRSRRPINRG
ncbi:MAG: YfhO family protein [Anaerolineae bacterium]